MFIKMIQIFYVPIMIVIITQANIRLTLISPCIQVSKKKGRKKARSMHTNKWGTKCVLVAIYFSVILLDSFGLQKYQAQKPKEKIFVLRLNFEKGKKKKKTLWK